MKKEEWVNILTDSMESLGFYKQGYDNTIASLASILSMRDAAETKYIEEGEQVTIEKVSDRGARNRVVNPLVTLVADLNEKALAYFEELGMTPKSRKRLLDNSGNIGSLAEAIKVLDGQKPETLG